MDKPMVNRGTSESGSSSRTLRDRLAVARAQRFVGRHAELSLWQERLRQTEPDFAVLWIAGPGGVGKTTLLQQMSQQAAQAGWSVAWIDCRHLVSTSEAFLSAVAAAQSDAQLPDARRVLFIDTAEDLGVLEDWLREHYLPTLPEHDVVVFAGRRPPGPGFRSDAAWSALLRVLSLRNLPADDCRNLLERRGVAPALHDELIRSTYGYPLALSLVADVISSEDDVTPTLAAQSPDVVAAMLERFSHQAPDALHRRALYVAAHVRVTDEALLRHAVDEQQAGALYAWLASLSFAISGPEGLYLHDLAAHALDTELRRRDPSEYLALHKRVREPALERLRSRSATVRFQAASDLCWLHRFSPVMGALVDWGGARSLYADVLRPADHDAIVEATRRFEGEQAARAMAFWIARQPESFTIGRISPTQPVGFIVTVRLTAEDCLDPEVRERDPRVAAAFEHTRQHGPLRPGEHLVIDYWMTLDQHLAPGPFVSQVSIRDVCTWGASPGLAWTFYSLVPQSPAHPMWSGLMAYLDHHPGPELRLDDTGYHLHGHDWRAQPPTAFFDVMAEREVFGADAQQASSSPSEQLLVLSQDAFVDAVRQCLRTYCDDAKLNLSPLMRSRVAHDAPGGNGHVLRRLIDAAAQQLTLSGKDETLHGALKLTYLDPARTQEEAAELLGLPFSTYRRHLAAAQERVASYLWHHELHGHD